MTDFAKAHDPTGKTCSACPHPAHSAWSWAPGHMDGFRCVCCIRKVWEETLANLKEGLAKLPDSCIEATEPVEEGSEQ